MGLDSNTAVRWGDVETVMEKLSERNRRLRIINDSLHTRVKAGDPLYCWDGGQEEYVYIRKSDWLKASPALRTTEACIILRITPAWFKRRRDELEIVAKDSIVGVKGVPKQYPQKYYSVSDIIEISRELPIKQSTGSSASADEIRRLFAHGYTTYKKSRAGDYLPVWDESI